MQEEICGPGRTYNEAKAACEISECIEPATYAAISSGVSLGPPAGAVMAGITYAACKGLRGIEKSSTVSRQTKISTQNRNQFDPAPQISVDNNEPYYKDLDPVLDNELDTWRTEEEFVTVDDVEQDFAMDFDLSPDQGSLYTDSSKNSMKSWA